MVRPSDLTYNLENFTRVKQIKCQNVKNKKRVHTI